MYFMFEFSNIFSYFQLQSVRKPRISEVPDEFYRVSWNMLEFISPANGMYNEETPFNKKWWPGIRPKYVGR